MSRRSLALFATCGGAFLAFLDTTIVNTSFPDIRASFADATPAELSWILDAYFIALAALLVPAGGIADRYGRRRVFLGGVVVFISTSLLCAIAPSWELLVAARVLQGLAAATMVSVSLALLLPLFPLERRAAGVGIWGAAAALAATVGPPLGGVLVEIADWRWIFLVNLPLGAMVLVRHAARRGRESRRGGDRPARPGRLGARRRRARRARPRDRRGQRLGLGLDRRARLLRRSRRPARGGRGAQPQPPAPARRPRALPDPLLPDRDPRHDALRRRVLLDDPGQHPLPHRGLGLLRPARRPGGDPRPADFGDPRRARRQARRPVRPPRRDRPGHAPLRRRPRDPDERRHRSPTTSRPGCPGCSSPVPGSGSRSRPSAPPRRPRSPPTASASRPRSPQRAASSAPCSARRS